MYRGISANEFTRGVTVTNNEIYGHTPASGYDGDTLLCSGIRAYGTSDWGVTGNTIRANVRGIRVYGESEGFQITGNDIWDNAQGIAVDTISGTVGSANFNSIFDNTVSDYTAEGITPQGVVNSDSSAEPTVLDATHNWWGDASGPSDEGPGTGDAVSTNVDYDPWLGAGVEDAESESITGTTTITDTLTGGDVTITTTNSTTHTVTTAKYDNNPGGDHAFVATGYYDIHLDNTDDVDSVTIEFCKNMDANTTIYYWDGDDWVACSDQAFDPATGCVVVTISDTTNPDLDYLSGGPFASGRTPVGGLSRPASRLELLESWLRSLISTLW
ncbi:MAG: NosD domain-containing protein [Anaerolineae bacterium]